MGTLSLDDTIVAVSSPPGRAARGLLRISGPDLQLILNGLEANRRRETAQPTEPGRMGRFNLAWAGGDALPALLTCFLGPRSYTGQDVAELQVPGNPALLERLVRQVVCLGARRAEPGEFTYRRFMAGKIDLMQAEGVAATIAAVSDAQLDAAARLRAGRLGEMAHRFVEQLGDILALVESGIDFTDQEDVVPVTRQELIERLAAVRTGMEHLLERSISWARLDALPRVVMVGRPSVGKSSLFNALLGRQRTVTAAEWGTTRDCIIEPLLLVMAEGRQVEVMLEDLPGIEPGGPLLKRNIWAGAQRVVEEADLVLAIDDGRTGPLPLGDLEHGNILHVHSKSDLQVTTRRPADLAVSAMNGVGLKELRHAIADRVGRRGASVEGAALVLQARHAELLAEARRHLSEVNGRLAEADGDVIEEPEIVAAELRDALDNLAALGGAVTPDDVIGRVFATFCVGK